MLLALTLTAGNPILNQSSYTFVNAEASALVARFTTQPTNARKLVIDNLVGSLKTAGVWTKMDVLYVRAAADSQAARLNWIADQYNSTAFSSPLFTADRGYTPDGSASYLDSGFNPTTAVGAKFLQDNAHLGAWHRTDLANAGATSSNDIGNATSRILNSGTMITQTRPNSSATGGSTTEDYAKHKVYSRDGSASWRYFSNGVISGADPRVTPVSEALTNYNFGTGRTAAASFGLNQEAVSHWGGYLTAAEIAAMTAAFSTYLTAVGAA